MSTWLMYGAGLDTLQVSTKGYYPPGLSSNVSLSFALTANRTCNQISFIWDENSTSCFARIDIKMFGTLLVCFRNVSFLEIPIFFSKV